MATNAQLKSEDSTAEARAKRPRSRVTVGNVTVAVQKPTPAEVRQNVEKGTEALKRLKAKLMRPGIRVYARKGVPLYSADPDRPGVYIRKLDGRIERGVLQDGAFKVTA